MPFDVVFDIAHDQQRVLLEHSKLQGVGDADFVPQSVSCSCFSSRGTGFFPALCFISAIHPFFSSGMRLNSLSYALSRLSWEFHYPIFFYEKSGSDFACIFCAVARQLARQPRYGLGPRRSRFEDL